MAKVYEFPRDRVCLDKVEQNSEPAEVIILDYMREDPDEAELSWMPEFE